jgi:hypothetical protein
VDREEWVEAHVELAGAPELVRQRAWATTWRLPTSEEAFDLAQRLGRFAHLFGWVTVRRLLPDPARDHYDIPFQTVLRRALAYT